MNNIISVIVPVYQDWEHLKICLDALSSQSLSSEFFEIIVVNNDPESECPYPFPSDNIRLIMEERPGSYAARNTGIKAGYGDIFAFTDADCIPDREWLKNGLKALKMNTDIERVAGRIELYFQDKKLTWAEIYEKVFAFPQNDYVKHRKMGVTANLFVNRSVFEIVGMFNEDLYSGGDAEWGNRAHQAGYMVGYADDVVVKHPARSTISELTRKRKRTRGGKFIIELEYLSKTKRAINLIYEFMPPVFTIRPLFKRDDISFNDKIVAFIVHFYIKQVGAFHRLFLEIGLKQPRRS